MRGKHHLIVATIFFLALSILVDKVTYSMILAPIVVTLYPDLDHHFETHRNFLFHSIIVWVPIFMLNYNIYHLLFILSVGIHLLCDITPYPSKWTGYYVLKWRKGGVFKKGPLKQGVMSTLWYFFNFVAAVGLFLLQINTI